MESASSTGFAEYVEAVRGRLEAQGFTLAAGDEGAALVGHRRQVKLTRFGFVDTVVAIARGEPGASAGDLTELCERSFRNARRLKIRIPRGLFSQLVSYPALVVDEATPELQAFAQQYTPKHWAAMDFPSVVELSSGSLLRNEKTPVWGAAYYKKSREEAGALLAPR